MTHAMADTETLGTKPGCCILSLGAVIFDPRGFGYFNQFYRTIDLASCIMLGLTVNEGTVKWWREQSVEAQQALSVDTRPVRDVMVEFQQWCIENKVDRFWCHGATFDAPIVAESFEKLGLELPWRYTQIRDTRTVFDLFDYDLSKAPRIGVHHNALDDAIFQVNCVQAALAKGLSDGR